MAKKNKAQKLDLSPQSKILRSNTWVPLIETSCQFPSTGTNVAQDLVDLMNHNVHFCQMYIRVYLYVLSAW